MHVFFVTSGYERVLNRFIVMCGTVGVPSEMFKRADN